MRNASGSTGSSSGATSRGASWRGSSRGAFSRVPELPEVETIARGVHREVAGARIVGVDVPRPDVLRVVTQPRAFARRVTGQVITKVARRAKHVVVTLSDG